MKDHLHQECYARSCRKFEELKRRCYQEEILKNIEDGKNFLRSMIRNHEQWVRNTRENMSIHGNVSDCQHAQRDPEELFNYSRNLATPSGIANDVKDSEKRRN